MTKKKPAVEVTIRVLGEDLTRAEAEELYAALTSALGKVPTIQYLPYHPYTPKPYIPWYTTNTAVGPNFRSTGPDSDPQKTNYLSSMMVAE